MPFAKKGNNDYVSPSGRHFTKKQVQLYYATDGFTKQVSTHPIKRDRRKKKR